MKTIDLDFFMSRFLLKTHKNLSFASDKIWQRRLRVTQYLYCEYAMAVSIN